MNKTYLLTGVLIGVGFLILLISYITKEINSYLFISGVLSILVGSYLVLTTGEIKEED